MKETQYPQYFVTEHGDVFSNKSGGIKKMKPQNHKDGYLMIGVWNNNQRKGIYVHRLVAQIFIPNPDSKPEVNHKNGIKNDNRVENLEWVTNKENVDHAILNGLNNCIGEKHGMAKLTEEKVLQIRQLYSQRKYNKTNQTKLAEMYGMTQTQISYIINKKTWKHI